MILLLKIYKELKMFLQIFLGENMNMYNNITLQVEGILLEIKRKNEQVTTLNQEINTLEKKMRILQTLQN